MNIIIITGTSGSGKTQAANTLEDMGYYCIDNMPVPLLSQFAELFIGSKEKITDAAFVIDVRGEIDFSDLTREIKVLEETGNTCRIVYLESEDSVLINRYKESRRSHPLTLKYGISIKEALEREKALLKPLREMAYIVIDTTMLSLIQLKQKIQAALTESGNESMKNIFITCTSFGFKNGIPSESDNIFDIRCFPNPYYISELKELTGLDHEVKDFVFSFDITIEFLNKLFDMIDFLIPLYVNEGRTQLNLAVGCTGGKHRSVAVCEALGKHISDNGYKTVIIHRDIKN